MLAMSVSPCSPTRLFKHGRFRSLCTTIIAYNHPNDWTLISLANNKFQYLRSAYEKNWLAHPSLFLFEGNRVCSIVGGCQVITYVTSVVAFMVVTVGLQRERERKRECWKSSRFVKKDLIELLKRKFIWIVTACISC